MSIVYFFKVIAVARTADLVVMMLDATKGDKQKELLTAELESVGIRLNKKRPGKKKKNLEVLEKRNCLHKFLIEISLVN